jgi:tetratricopeptide (TPR) repeat protein
MDRTAPRAAALVIASAAALAFMGCASTPRPDAGEDDPVVQLSPAEAAAQTYARGEALAQQGLTDQALAEFERAILENPELTVAYLGAGEIHRQRGDFTRAEQSFARAASLEPRNFDAQYMHALSLQLLNRLEEAIRAYLRALSIEPNDFEANLNVATAYLQLAEPREALVYGLRAVRIDGNSAAARVNLAAVYAALDEHEMAVTEYQQAAELMTLTPELLLSLADSLGKVGRYAEMESTLERVVQTERSAVALERLGSARFRLRKYPSALAAFREAVAVDPNHYPALNGIAVCRLNDFLWSDRTDLEAHREAIDTMRQSLRINRDQPKIVELLARYK